MIHENCPTCRREFKSAMDYPQIQVLEVTIPEGGFTAYRGGWVESIEGGKERAEEEGKKNAELLSQLLKQNKVSLYLRQLQQLERTTIAPASLKPLLKASGYFKWAYPIAKGSDLLGNDEFWGQYYLGLQDNKLGVCEIALFQTGPNMGSAGGPTLSPVGTIATIKYDGKLVI